MEVDAFLEAVPKETAYYYTSDLKKLVYPPILILEHLRAIIGQTRSAERRDKERKETEEKNPSENKFQNPGTNVFNLNKPRPGAYILCVTIACVFF